MSGLPTSWKRCCSWKNAALDVGLLAAGAGISSALQRTFYPSGLPHQVTVVRVPRWALVYGALVWPPLGTTTEEMV
jgi:hypothetical protein